MPNDHPRKFDPEDDPFVIEVDPDDLDPAQEQQTVVGTDPWLETFSHSPYDPVYGAQAAGRLTGLMIGRPRRRWMRLVGWVVAAAFLAGTFLRLTRFLFS